MVVEATYDRSTQDVGNILLMEHVNVLVPEQQTAINFYISALGLTRDPYMMVGQDNMWANAGKQQFHLPTRGNDLPDRLILVEYLDGPFSFLENRWRFTPLTDTSCDIHFFIRYSFRSRMLERLMGGLFAKAVRKYTEAFEERADKVFGPPSMKPRPISA